MNPRYNLLHERTREIASKFSARFIAIVATLVTLLAITSSAANAQLLVEEFNYAPAALLTANGWVAHSGGGTNAQAVSAPSLSYPGYVSSGIGNSVLMATSGEDDNRAVTLQTTGSVYYAALLNVTSSTATGDYVAHFGQTSGAAVSIFASRLFVKKDPSASTNYALGVNQGSSAGATVYTPFSYVPGTTYLVVVKHTFVAGATNDAVSLFVNPVINGSEPAALVTTVTGTADMTGIASICLRQGSAANAPVLRVDGIRVGTAWTDVVPAPASQYRSAASGDWGTAATWEKSTDGGAVWAPSGTTPTSADGAIAVRAGHTVTVAASVAADELTIAATGDLLVAGGQTLTIADGAGTDATVNGQLQTSGTIAGTGSIAINGGAFRINDGGWGGNTNVYAYDSLGRLIFANSGFYGVNSDAVWWPASSGPQYVDVFTSSGGITLNVPRTVGASIVTQGGLTYSGGNSLTAGGIVQLNPGGYVPDPITYLPGSTLIYNTGGGYGIYNEWLGGTSQPGVPYNVTIQASTAVDFNPNRSSTPMSALGNVSIGGGSSLALGSSAGGDLSVGGNWSNGGTFTPNGRQVSFNGSAAQTIANNETFAYLNINNAAGVSTSLGASVTNTLSFTVGKLNTLGNTVSVDAVSGAATGQYVNGFLLKPLVIIAAMGTQTFEVGDANEYAPVEVNVTAAPGNLSILASTTAAENPSIGTSAIDPTKSVNRYWTVTSAQSATYNATFTFVGSDVDGGANTANFRVAKLDGGTWTTGGAGTATATSTQGTGFSNFSQFAVGELAAGPTITASAGAGGSISPSGAVTVISGANQDFTITADPCYSIADVIVDGSSVGAVGTYTFTNVLVNHTIAASFVLNTYTITSVSGPGGSISPLGNTVVNCGANQIYTFTADPCYAIADVTVDAVSQGTPSSYTFTNVQAAHTIAVTFVQQSFTITASAGPNGSIAPSGAVVVLCGNNQDFTITPDPTYSIADVLVDGISQGQIGTYTFTNVTANHTISATFTSVTYTLTVTTSGSGSVLIMPNQPSYASGALVTITATANAGSHFDVYSGDATGHTNPVVVTMDANKTINAAFLANVYSWNQTAGSSSFATTTNWTPTRWSNSADDVLQFNAGGSSTATGVTTQTIAQLTVSGSTAIALQSASPQIVTIAGGTGSDLDVAAGSALSLNGTFALQLTLGASSTASVGGTVTVTGAAHRINPPVVANSVVFAGGSLCTAATGFTGNLFGTTGLNAVHFQSGSIYAQSAGSNPFGAPQPTAVTVFETGSRFRLEGTLIPAMSGRSYADFEMNVLTPGFVSTPSGGSACKVDNIFMTQGFIRWGMTGQFDIKGNITVNSGATLLFAGQTAAPVVTLSGTSPQTITVAPGGVFNDSTNTTVDVKNATGIVLGSDVTLPGIFKFTTGNVTTGANTLSITGATSSLTGAGTGTGYVVGNLRRTLVPAAGEASRTFDIGDASNYTPVLVAAHGAPSNFDLRGSQTTPDHPNLATSGIDGAKSVNRYYTLAPSGSPTFSTYDARFNYAAADVDGGANTSNFIIERWDGGSWNGTGTTTNGVNYAEISGITSFSDFAIGEASSWTITASAGPEGTISPSGAVVVPDAGSQIFTITAGACYTIADVLVDGVSVGAVGTYTFSNVTADHTIAASFGAAGPYTITASAGAGGSISPSGAVIVTCGATQDFTIAADPCFAIQDVLVDGVSVGAVATYTFNNVQANHTIAASFVGTTSATSNALTVSPSPSVCQQAISITSTLTPNTATGSVEFFDGVTSLGSVAVTAGTAVLSVPAGLSVGAHTLKGEFTPTGCFLASTSPNKAHTVNKAPVTIALTSDINPSIWAQPVTFTATVSPATATGTVTFRDSTTTLATVPLSGGIANYVKSNLYTGNHTSITATYNGDACYLLKASSAYSQLVYRAATTTTLTTNINPSNYNQVIQLTATVVIGATNRVYFYSDGNLMGTANVNAATGLATLNNSNLLPGKHELTASYQGDSHYEPSSTAGSYSQVVNQLPSSVVLTANPSPATCQSPVTLTATVSPGDATGTAEFFNGATSLGTAPVLGGVATLVTAFNVGTHSLHADYLGDIIYSASTSANTSLTVSKTSPAIALSSDVNPSIWAQPVTFSATLTPSTATGTVTFKDSLTTIGTAPVIGGVAQLVKSNLYTGNHTSITAVYSGDACYLAKTSAAYSQLVYRSPTTVSVVTNINPSTYGQTIQLIATVSPLGATNRVYFYDGLNLMGTALVNALTGLAVLNSSNLLSGKHELFVTYQGDSHFSPSAATATYSHVVDPAPTSVTLVSDINPSKFGSAIALTATVTPSDASGTVEYFDGVTSLGTAPVISGAATLSTSVLSAGSHSLTAVYSGDAGYAGSTSAAYAQDVTADQPPVVTVVFPNGGENIFVGGDVKLIWTATDNTAVVSVTLEVSRDYGTTWLPIQVDIPNTGSYVWHVQEPGTNTTPVEVYSALFRVTAKDNAGVEGADQSDNYFSIFDAVTAAVVTKLEAEPLDLGIRISWAMANRSVFTSLVIERSAFEEGPWNELTAEVRDEAGVTTAEDRTAEAGKSYFYRLRGTTNTGMTAVFGPVKGTAAAPREFSLSAAWPNPSKGAVSLNFSVATSARVKVSVIDLQGREVSTLADGEFAPGRYQVRWDGKSDRGQVPAGVYFIRCVTPVKTMVTRITIAQ